MFYVYIPFFFKVWYESFGDFIGDVRLIIDGGGCHFIGFVVEERVVEKDGGVIVYSLCGEVRYEDIERFSDLEETHGAVTNQYGVAGFIEVLSIVADNFVVRVAQPWEGVLADIDNE